MAFEEEFGAEIPDEDAEKLTTVGAVMNYLGKRFGRIIRPAIKAGKGVCPSRLSTWTVVMRKVVVTGLGVVSPLGSQLDVFWKRNLNGVSGIRRVQRFDCSPYPSQIGGEVIEFNADDFLSKRANAAAIVTATSPLAPLKWLWWIPGWIGQGRPDPLRRHHWLRYRRLANPAGSAFHFA